MLIYYNNQNSFLQRSKESEFLAFAMRPKIVFLEQDVASGVT